jgi:16S rRNA (adenine1518-N6/adenine1519-N6)-dimethyltransferase
VYDTKYGEIREIILVEEHPQIPTVVPQAGDERDLTNVYEIRKLLSTHNMRPHKSFGQNFLIDRSVLQTIVDAAEINPDDEILEVGAGTGVLTQELARHARHVVAVEVERDMLVLLKETTSNYPNVELVAGNLLHIDPVKTFGQATYKLVANLPYYITAPTFRHFLESSHPPRLLIVMVQLEVAQRITAGPGDLSLLGVSVQFYGQPRIVARVPSQAFYPAPKVDSAILRVDVHPQQTPLSLEERNRFFRVVQAGFSERRKQLHNSLTHSLHYKNEHVRSWLAMAEIEASRRAETLSIAEWLRLWHIIEDARESGTSKVTEN